MKNTPEKIVERLSYLTSIAEDAKKGYEIAAAYVEDINMKDLFFRFSHERTGYKQELDSLIKNMQPGYGRGVTGHIYRTWMDVKAAFMQDRDAGVIGACIPGEETAVKVYTETLNEEYIPGNVKRIINRQLIGICNALEFIRKYGTGAVI